MSLTVSDVCEIQFSQARGMRTGYVEEEVDDFLDVVIAALEERDRTIAELVSNLAVEHGSLPQTRAATTDVGVSPVPADDETDLLALAQKIAEVHMGAAQREAARMMANARRDASDAISAGQGEAARLVAEGEQQRARALEALHQEQRQLANARSELASASERARADVEAFLLSALTHVRQGQPLQSTELKALSA